MINFMMPPKKKKPEFSSEVINYLELNFQLPAERTTDSCLIGHMILLYAKSHRLLTRTVEQVNKLFEVKATYEQVKNLVKKSKCLAGKYSSPVDQQHFEDFCKESFMTSNNFNMIPLTGYRELLASNFSLPEEENIPASSCLKGHALHLYFNENPSVYETSRQINKLFGLSSKKYQIRKLILQAKTLLRFYKRQCPKFEILCNEPFICTPKPTPSITTELRPSTHLSESTQGEDPTSEACIEITTTTVSVGTNTGEDPLRLSREDLNSIEMQLKNRLTNLSHRIANASKQNKRKLAELRSKLKNMPIKLKVLNQKVKRKTATIKALRRQIHELQKDENRKKIRYLKVKKYSSNWKIKHSDHMNSNKVVITCTDQTNPLEENKNNCKKMKKDINCVN